MFWPRFTLHATVATTYFGQKIYVGADHQQQGEGIAVLPFQFGKPALEVHAVNAGNHDYLPAGSKSKGKF